MRKIVSICLLFLLGFTAFAQKMKPEYVEINPDMEKQFQTAKSLVFAGSVVELVSVSSELAGLLMTGGEKVQQAGKICRIAGAAGMIVGAGMIWAGGSKIHEIKTSSGKTLATISFGSGQYGSGLKVKF